MVCASFGVSGRNERECGEMDYPSHSYQGVALCTGVQASQVGYHPGQKKVAVIELDKRDTDFRQPALYRIAADGLQETE